MITHIANRILFFLFYFDWRKFQKNANDSVKIQNRYLLKLLKKNANTRFGQKFQFHKINDLQTFQNYVPISQYEDYKGYIEAMKAGNQKELTHSKVDHFSISSGTASASKLIPYTKELNSEFDRCISVWMFDLYRKFPPLLNGKAFWIITPSSKSDLEESNVPVGFDDDSGYFSPVKKWLIRNIFVVPDVVPKYCHGENYYFALAVFLLREKKLRLISIWNPMVMIILLKKIILYKEKIISSTENGRLCFPDAIEENLKIKLEKYLKPDNKRAMELNAKLRSDDISKQDWSEIWPHLCLLSAWDSSWAAGPASELQKLFPKVFFQGKGLLATEACVTFPAYFADTGFNYYPVYYSHFFEFEDIESKAIYLMNQLEEGHSYEVIITTGGGFYRYRLNDIVHCKGYFKSLPKLEFVGKSNLVSDLTGEKLNEYHVAKVLQEVFENLNITTSLYYLSPMKKGDIFAYCLYINTKSQFDSKLLSDQIDKGLKDNFHYLHSRELGQLGQVEINLINSADTNDLIESIDSNRKLSTFKFSVLQKGKIPN